MFHSRAVGVSPPFDNSGGPPPAGDPLEFRIEANPAFVASSLRTRARTAASWPPPASSSRSPGIGCYV